jgi:type II secretory pathway pseudopilin PulG
MTRVARRRREGGPRRGRGGAQDGWTITELLIVLATGSVLLALTVPLTARAKDASRARHAAGFVAAKFRAARQQAIVRERFVGVVFDLTANGWQFRICIDGNGNGIRRADITAGTDACPEGPFVFGTLFPTVDLGMASDVPTPDGDVGSDDPVRFGSSNIASFSPFGSCTAGSLYVRSSLGTQYAVRVAGVTARTRVLKYDPQSQTWKDG